MLMADVSDVLQCDVREFCIANVLSHADAVLTSQGEFHSAGASRLDGSAAALHVLYTSPTDVCTKGTASLLCLPCMHMMRVTESSSLQPYTTSLLTLMIYIMHLHVAMPYLLADLMRLPCLVN